MTIKEFLAEEKRRADRLAEARRKPMTKAELRQWFAMRESRAS